MTDRNPLFELEIQPVVTGARGASHSLHRQLKAAILDGRLKAGTQLPPGRLSGACFGVSRNTIAEVYGRLVADGLAVGRHGSGTYVVPGSAAGRAIHSHASTELFLAPTGSDDRAGLLE